MQLPLRIHPQHAFLYRPTYSEQCSRFFCTWLEIILPSRYATNKFEHSLCLPYYYEYNTIQIMHFPSRVCPRHAFLYCPAYSEQCSRFCCTWLHITLSSCHATNKFEHSLCLSYYCGYNTILIVQLTCRIRPQHAFLYRLTYSEHFCCTWLEIILPSRHATTEFEHSLCLSYYYEYNIAQIMQLTLRIRPQYAFLYRPTYTYLHITHVLTAPH